MKLDFAVRELHGSETALVRDLLTVSDRHTAEHEIHHVTRDLAGWSRGHVHELTVAGRGFGLRLDGDAPGGSSPLATIRTALGQLPTRRAEPGLLLLADLRRLHRKIAGVSVEWELLARDPLPADPRHLRPG